MPPNIERTFTDNILRDLKPGQLRAMGAVAVAWNQAEHHLRYIMSAALMTPEPLWDEVSTRINGFDGIKELTRMAFELHFVHVYNFPEVYETIDITLGGLQEYKRYRDAVIHAQVLDAPTGVGWLIQRRGKHEQVMLSMKALVGLYKRLRIIHFELSFLWDFANEFIGWDSLNNPNANKQPNEQSIRDLLSQLRKHQKRRLSLRPLPAFPDLSPKPLPLE
jgi:hypothetical protein